jgi:hypothetical protein
MRLGRLKSWRPLGRAGGRWTTCTWLKSGSWRARARRKRQSVNETFLSFDKHVDEIAASRRDGDAFATSRRPWRTSARAPFGVRLPALLDESTDALAT